MLTTASYNIALGLFGLFDLLFGYLFKSTFLPRIVGVSMSLAGVAFLAPAFRRQESPMDSGVWVRGGPVILSLLVKGVDAERWTDKARDAAAKL